MSERWQTTKQAGVACGVCGKSDTCKVAPDSGAFLCRRDGNTVHQMASTSNGNGRGLNGHGTGYVGRAHRKPTGNGGPMEGHARPPAGKTNGASRAFATADLAIAAAGASIHGGVLAAVATYRNADGTEALRVARFHQADGGKSFRPVSPCKAGWRIGDPPGPLPLYRLPELVISTATVFVCEGEKAADAADAIGLMATTSAHGSASPGLTDWSPLAGLNVVLLPDHDDPGGKYARAVATILVGLDPPATVRIVNLPGLPAGGDIVEYIAAAHDAIEADDVGAEVGTLAEATAPIDPADLIGGPVVTCMADVTSRSIAWLWHHRFPMGRLSLLVGVPGVGKSYFTTDVAARVSTGSDWPDGSPCVAGDVLFVTAEDDAADTIRPRLDACGADVTRVHQLTAVRRVDPETGKPADVMFTLADVAALASALRRLPDCRLVVIDPIGSFLGGDVDSHRDNEVRGVLAPVALLAQQFDVAVLIVAHRRKGSAGSADETAMGSRAFTGIVRTAWHLSRDPMDPTRGRRLFLAGKNNLAAEGDGLAFSIQGQPVGAVVWESGPVTMTADDAMLAERSAEASGGEGAAKPGPAPEARDAAATWLLAELADLAEHKVADVRHATEAAGLAWRTVQRARESIGALVEKGQFGGGYIWRLAKPANPPAHEPEPAA